jgi:hypothetical protein
VSDLHTDLPKKINTKASLSSASKARALRLGGWRDDAFAIHQRCGGKVLLCCYEIIGGSGGLGIYTTNVHIKDTDIQLAASKGIFDNIIEDSAVYNCGGYGIKGRSGWHEKGTNELQSGPWSSIAGPSGML